MHPIWNPCHISKHLPRGTSLITGRRQRRVASLKALDKIRAQEGKRDECALFLSQLDPALLCQGTVVPDSLPFSSYLIISQQIVVGHKVRRRHWPLMSLVGCLRFSIGCALILQGGRVDMLMA